VAYRDRGGDVYQRNGGLITNEMGHKTAGKWRIEKDHLCLDRSTELGSGCYEVWLSGQRVELWREGVSLPLEGILQRPAIRN
jgi:hypothetical protein